MAAVASAELYDPATGTWTATAPLTPHATITRRRCCPMGKVLVAGGYRRQRLLASAELYDVGLGFSAVLAAADCLGHLAAQPWQQPGAHRLTVPRPLRRLGRQFPGFAGRLSAGAIAEPGKRPDVVPVSTNWQTNSFTSAPVSGFPPGWALATVFVNGIPSTGSVINISVPVPTAITLTDARG